MMGTLGVVVVSYNSAEDLPSCLAALSAAEGVAKIVVVDNASTDTSRGVVANHGDDRIDLLALETNTGFAGGCNRGFSAIAGECGIVAFVNPDVSVAPDCLRLAAEKGARHSLMILSDPLSCSMDPRNVTSGCLALFVRVFTEDSGGGGSGAGDLGRQVEGNGRLSIVPGPRSRVGRCGTFKGEKRKFLSVTLGTYAAYFCALMMKAIAS